MVASPSVRSQSRWTILKAAAGVGDMEIKAPYAGRGTRGSLSGPYMLDPEEIRWRVPR
jgi:hypothetical protein